MGDLAIAEQIQPPSVTKLVRDMEVAGLISTSRDSKDRRATRVRMTPAGRRELERIRQRKTEFLELRLASLSARDQTRAEELVTFLEALLEDE